MKNSEKRCRFTENCYNSYKKCGKVIKLYRNSAKLYEKFWEKVSSEFNSEYSFNWLD